jgi:dTDP-glucose pyrophosphorylase
MENLKIIVEKIQKLPPSLRGEVENYIDFLLNKKQKNKKRILRQDWAGSLKDISNEYTSVELQKKALEWRIK